MSVRSSEFFTLRWSNWPLALAAAVVVIPLAVATLPSGVAFWITGLAVALVVSTLVVRAAGRAGARDAVRDEHIPAALVLWPQLLQLPRQPHGAADLRRTRLLRARRERSDGLGSPAHHRDHRRADRDRADGRRVPARPALRQRIPAAALSPDPRAHADDALLRRDGGVLPLLLRADLRAAEPDGPPAHRRALRTAAIDRRRHGGHRLRRRLDVVALRHAAGAVGPRQRAEIPLRSGGYRPRLAVAALLGDHVSLHPRPAPAGAEIGRA